MKFCKITSISSIGTKPVVHLTVDKNHNFFANNLCVHNCGYRGTIGVILKNLGNADFYVAAGDKIAQMVIAKVETAEMIEFHELSETERAAGGFGSTDGKTK